MPDWNRIRAEYVAGGISQRQLAKKHDVPFSTIQKRSHREKWKSARDSARIIVAENVLQKTADKAADNATLAKDMQRKLLILLNDIIDAFPANCTEYRFTEGAEVHVWRLTDITRAFRELTADMGLDIKEESRGILLLRSLLELERSAGNG